MNRVHVAGSTAGGRVRADLAAQERSVGQNGRARSGLRLQQRVSQRPDPLVAGRGQLGMGLARSLRVAAHQVGDVRETIRVKQVAL